MVNCQESAKVGEILILCTLSLLIYTKSENCTTHGAI